MQGIPDMTRSFALLSSANINKLYKKTIDVAFAIILLFITLTMIIGVLTLFILIELSRSLFEYFSTRRLRLTPIIDADIMFVLRHIMIDLFDHKYRYR